MTVRDLFNRMSDDYDVLAAAAGYRSGDWLDPLLATLPSCQNAVDFACARGMLGLRIRARFPDVRLVGVDVADKMVAVARSTGAYDEVLQHDLNEPMAGLPSGSFQLAVALGFLEFVTRPEPFLSTAARVLAPGGTLLVSFMEHRPQGPEAPQRHVRGTSSSVQIHSYAEGEACRLLQAQGLEVAETRACTAYVAEDGSPRPYLVMRALRR